MTDELTELEPAAALFTAGELSIFSGELDLRCFAEPVSLVCFVFFEVLLDCMQLIKTHLDNLVSN